MTNMMSSKPERRSILGTRVAVPISSTHYAPATVQAVRNDVKGNEYVSVKFDDNNKGECLLSQVVGTGYKSIHDIQLHKNQKVFTIHNGREVAGTVEQHLNGIVVLNLGEGERNTSRSEDEVRLTESRHSPRLQDHNQDLDYRKIASANASPNHGKKRPVSASIEVPKASRARKSSAEPTMDELMAAMVLSSLSSSPVFHTPKSPSVKKDSSPHSYGSSGVGSWSQENQMSPARGELPPQGACHPVIRHTPERNKTVIQLAPSSEHSPGSTGDPIEVDPVSASDTSIPMDEDGHEPAGRVVSPGHSTPAPFGAGSPRSQVHVPPSQSPTYFLPYGAKHGKLESVKEETNDREDLQQPNVPWQPTFFYIPPGFSSAQTMGRPEYVVHLQPVSTPPPPLAPAERNLSPFPRHQNEGLIPSPDDRVHIGSAPASYYTIPMMGSSPLASSPLTFTPGSHVRHTPSPLATGPSGTGTAQMQGIKLITTPRNIPMSAYTTLKDHPYPATSAQPINIPAAKAFSWHASGAPQSFSPKPSILQQRQQMHHAASPKMGMSPKSIPPGRKVRGDGKKCRKVYGMENRDMWCTACRWKKACQRFPD